MSVDKKSPVLVVMAAGMGSRFGGLKQIEDVDGRGHALIDYAIYDAALAGFDEVVFIIREEIAKDFKESVGKRIEAKLPVTYVYQALDMIPEGCEIPEGRNKPWGTTHAIWCCREVLKGRDFLTVNADDFYGRQAFIDAINFFNNGGPDNEYGIIGYNVVSTLNENFSVSRGICSVDEEGFPNVKAMLKPRNMEGIKSFYFSTNTSSMRVKQYINNPNACIYFYHKGLIKYVGVMLKGKMEVLTDQETKDMIWRKGDTMFYKGGVTDPDYCVLKFTAESGRYYCDLKTESFTIE